MADLLGKAAAWLDDQRVRYLSRPVTYVRPSTGSGQGARSVEVQAAVGKTVFEVDSGTGILEKVESRDFLIRASELVLDGAVALPERGDKVREEGDGVTYVYEVMAPGREPHYRFSDPHRRALRIHTKLVDAEEA